MTSTVTLRNPEETLRWTETFSKLLQPGDIVFLRGPLGAGKTTLAQGIARHLGVTDPVTSPTYTLINEYTGRMRLNHLDLYRLSGSEEFELIGGWDVFQQDSVTLIEWPERLGTDAQTPTWDLELSIPKTGRTLSCRGPLGRDF